MGSKNKALNIPKDELYDLYINQKMTSKEIGEIFNCHSKSIRNYLHKYGIEVRSMGESVKLERSKWSEEKELQRSQNVHNAWVNKTPEELAEIHTKKMCSGKINSPEAVQKSRETKIKNGTSKTSKSEEEFYKKLILMGFDEDDIEHPYVTDKRYPFSCDFYIKSKDLFIEYQGHYTHYDEPFDSHNEAHIKLKEEFENKNYDMSTWTTRDPNKIATAMNNNIKLILVYPRHKTYLIENHNMTTIDINDINKI